MGISKHNGVMNLKSSSTPMDREETDGTNPVTDEESKTVMLTAERRDDIRIEEVVQRFQTGELPDELSVVRRISRYYGPELMLYVEIDGESRNYRLNAPGPGSYLHLWRAETEDGDLRTSYTRLAEVKATVLDGTYQMCPDCGEPFKTRRHERLAAIGRCPNEESASPS